METAADVVIRPMDAEQVEAAIDLILSVAGRILEPTDVEGFKARHFLELSDVAGFRQGYNPSGGLFLVVMDGETLIGTGAIRRLDSGTAELKRMWLLEAYQGQGIGYRLAQKLLAFARSAGYRRIYLTTGIEQARAIRFYKRLGFEPIDRYNNSESGDEIFLGLSLDDQNLSQSAEPLQ